MRIITTRWSVTAVLLCTTSVGCTLSTHNTEPSVAELAQMQCVAVLPFDNLSKDFRAGDIIADIFAGTLTVTDYFNVIEPSEVRLILAAQGQRYRSVTSATAARAYGQALGVDAVFYGSVRAYGNGAQGGRDAPPPIDFSSTLVAVNSGHTTWEGRVTHAREIGSLHPATSTTMAQVAIDSVVADLVDARSDSVERGVSRNVCANRPSLLALERIAERRAELAERAQRTGTELPTLPALDAAKGAAPGDLPALPVDDFGLPALPVDDFGLPALPSDDFGLPALPGLDSGLPALPDAGEGLPDTNGAPSPGALPELPDTGDVGAPPLPGEASPPEEGRDLEPVGDNDLPLLPDRPDVDVGADPQVDDQAPSAHDELPYVPAYAEKPPEIRQGFSKRQRGLLKLLYSDSSIIRRVFKGKSTKAKSKARKLFGDLAKIMRVAPDLVLAFEVHVDLGRQSQSAAMALAERRTAALQKGLTAMYSDLADRIFYRPVGDQQPLSKDVSKRARKQNTRVEIRRVYKR